MRHRQVRRLSEVQIEQMVEAYRSGKTVYQLAEVFGIHRITVGIILKRHGVVMRGQGLAESQRAEVLRLRADGMSYARIGERFGVGANTVVRFLSRS
ncbi:MAG: helix-turn-helix domain-containing protein [Propionibacteriaceae bacterium]|nr:helix-turn-helix domain-containing protein [Propionibacteriaceae bacterium]